MSEPHPARHPRGQHGPVQASLVSAACLLRRLPLFFCSTPRTPLRVLCLIAFDFLHVLRHARPLPRKRIAELALLLDFGACTNAVLDRRENCDAACQALRLRLEHASLGWCLESYLPRLQALEAGRPTIGGDHARFDEVRSYREAVVRLSLASLTAVALGGRCLEERIRTMPYDGDLETLFRLAMQCQVIDDILDYREDLSAALPSFLTACESRPLALALTTTAARSYAAGGDPASDLAVFPLRAALWVVTAIAKIAVRVHGAPGGPCRSPRLRA